MPGRDGRELAAIAVGGAIGALARVGLIQIGAGTAPGWPWVTFAVNVLGALLLGYFVTRLQERLPLSAYRRPLLGTGFCGAFTTFSTMQVELITMADEHGLAMWQKLMVYTSEQARHGRAPLHLALVRRLRESGAAGATCLRGVWGFHGEHPPHGDRLLQVRRHVPVVTVLLDTPERIAQWFVIVDEMTAQAGLVTSEMVPALAALSADGQRGGLRLARHRF